MRCLLRIAIHLLFRIRGRFSQKNLIIVANQNNKNEYKHTVLLRVHGGGPVVISLQQRLRYMTQIAKSIFQRKSH